MTSELDVVCNSALCSRILNEPELEGEINAAALGDLLPDELLVPLEDQYVCSQEVDRPQFTVFTEHNRK